MLPRHSIYEDRKIDGIKYRVTAVPLENGYSIQLFRERELIGFSELVAYEDKDDAKTIGFSVLGAAINRAFP